MNYVAVRGEIETFDVIAFEGKGLVSRLISWFSGGSVTHVGLALWVHGRLMLFESREFRGARIVWLSREIQGRNVSWYRPDHRKATFSTLDALRNPSWALANAGTGYSYLGLLRYAYRVLPAPLQRILPKPKADSREYGHRFCSELVSAVYCQAGADLRPDLSDARTSPAELVKTDLLVREGRLEA